MKSKLLLAAIAAPFIFAGMQTSALAACTKNASAVSCDALDLDTAADARTLIDPETPSIISYLFSTYSASWQTLINSYANSAGNGSGALDVGNATNNFTKDFTFNVNSPKVTATSLWTSIGSINAVISDGIAKIYANVSTNAYVTFKTSNGSSSSLISVQGGGAQQIGTMSVTAVPGPEAGAGLGALAMGGMAVWLKRRRKDEALAV